MPYKRRYRKKRSYKGSKSIASLALRVAMRNKKAQEIKTTASSHSGLVSNTGVVNLITGINEGTDYDDRVGKKITLRSLQIKGFMANNDSTLGDTTVIRLLIVRANGFSGVAPTIGDILLNSNAYSLRNPRPDLLRKYTVLYDTMRANDRDNPHNVFGKYRRLNSQAVFDGATVADVNKGALYVVMLSNRSTDVPTVAYQTLVKYVDE